MKLTDVLALINIVTENVFPLFRNSKNSFKKIGWDLAENVKY